MIERLAWVIMALVHVTPALAMFAPSLLTQALRLKRQAIRSTCLCTTGQRCFSRWWSPAFGVRIDPTPRKLGVVIVGASAMISFLGALFHKWQSARRSRQIAIADLIGLPALVYVAWRAFG